MKLFLLYLFAVFTIFAQTQNTQVYVAHMDAPACARMEALVGFRPCIQNIMVMAASPSKEVTGYEITIEYTVELGARRSQVAYVKATWQDAAMVGSYRFTDVDDITALKATAQPQTVARTVRR